MAALAFTFTIPANVQAEVEYVGVLSDYTQTPIQEAAFSPDGHRIACAYHRGFAIWDIKSGEIVVRLAGHGDGYWARGMVGGRHDSNNPYIVALEFTPDGKRLVSIGDDWTVRIWSTQDGKQLRLIGMPAWPAAGALTPDGKHLMTSASDCGRRCKRLCLWNINSGKPVHDFRGTTMGASSISFSGKSGIAATNGRALIRL